MAVSLSSSSPIVIFGAGYVGMSLGVLLSQEHHVLVIDTDPSKVTKINNKETTVKDNLIQKYLLEKRLHLSASLPDQSAYDATQIFIIATPTDYDERSNSFDT